VSFQVVALNAPPAPFVPEEHHLRLGFALVAVGFGSEESHRGVVDRVRRALPPALFELVTPMPYTALQQMFDEAFAWGSRAYVKALYLEGFTDEAIDVIVERTAATVSGRSSVHFYVLNGAYSAADDMGTAFSGGRSPRLSVFLVGIASDAAVLAEERVWVRGFYDALAPHALGKGGYVNELMADDVHRVPESYGTAKYARLMRIKAAYDPADLFHRNHGNIPPAT
jgi:hypothetical protein